MARFVALRLLAAFVLTGLPALAAEPCEDLSTMFERIAREADLEERPTLTLGMLGEQCKGLPSELRDVLAAAAHSSPPDRPLILGGGAADLPEEFASACPGWRRQPWAPRFASARPGGARLFRACQFARLGVVTEVEFAAAEVHFAVTALVVFQALRGLGLDAAVARRLARAVIVPSGEPIAPPPPPEKIIKFKDLNRK